jgi:DNA-binding MarR family transcriptional regulator
MVDSENRKGEADKLFRVLRRLRDKHSDMTMLQGQALFLVAMKPGLSQRQLLAELNCNDSTVARIMALLSDIGDRKGPGLDLVVMKVNPLDRRERLLFLSPKGKRLMEDIALDLERK